MDGTKIIRTVKLYLLVGREFPPDVRLFKEQVVEATSMLEILQHILEVRQKNAYSAAAYSFNFSDTTGEYPDMSVGSISESKSGVTGDCILALMLQVKKTSYGTQLDTHWSLHRLRSKCSERPHKACFTYYITPF